MKPNHELPHASRRLFLRQAGGDVGPGRGGRAAGAQPGGHGFRCGADRAVTTRRWCASSCSVATMPTTWCCPPTRPRGPTTAPCETRHPTPSRCWPQALRATQRSSSVLERLGGVLPIAPIRAQGRSFALHPAMAALKTLFDTDKRLAIVPTSGRWSSPPPRSNTARPRTPNPPISFHTTTSRTPGRPSHLKAPRSAGAGASVTWSRR